MNQYTLSLIKGLYQKGLCVERVSNLSHVVVQFAFSLLILHLTGN